MLRMDDVGVAALVRLHLLFSHNLAVRVGLHTYTIDASCHCQHQTWTLIEASSCKGVMDELATAQLSRIEAPGNQHG